MSKSSHGLSPSCRPHPRRGRNSGTPGETNDVVCAVCAAVLCPSATLGPPSLPRRQAAGALHRPLGSTYSPTPPGPSETTPTLNTMTTCIPSRSTGQVTHGRPDASCLLLAACCLLPERRPIVLQVAQAAIGWLGGARQRGAREEAYHSATQGGGVQGGDDMSKCVLFLRITLIARILQNTSQ